MDLIVKNFSMSKQDPPEPYQLTTERGANASEISTCLDHSPFESAASDLKLSACTKALVSNDRLSTLQASTKQLHDKISSEIIHNKQLDQALKFQIKAWMDLINCEKSLM